MKGEVKTPSGTAVETSHTATCLPMVSLLDASVCLMMPGAMVATLI